MPLLSRPEFGLFQNIAGSLAKIAEWTPDLVKALQEKPTTNHQRQVASLKRQSEGIVKIDEMLLAINNYATNEPNKEMTDSALKIAKSLKALRKHLTG